MNRFSPADFASVQQRFSDQISITARKGAGGPECLECLKKALKGQPYNFESEEGLMKRRRKGFRFKTIQDLPGYAGMPSIEGYDQWRDHFIRELGQKNHVIYAGARPHIFMPYGFKVLLLRSTRICAERMHAESRAKGLKIDAGKPRGRRTDEIGEIESALRTEYTAEDAFFEKIYPGWVWKVFAYDWVVDTGATSDAECAKIILSRWEQWRLRIKAEGNLIEDKLIPQLMSA